MSPIPLSGRQVIERLLAADYTPEEVIAECRLPMVVDFHGEVIEATPPGRRRLAALIAQMRGEVIERRPSDHWRQIVAAYRQAGPKPSQEVVASYLGWSASTMRRWYKAEDETLTSWSKVQARIEAEEAHRS